MGAADAKGIGLLNVPAHSPQRRKLSRLSLVDGVRQALVDAVFDGTYAPGDRLTEVSIARDLDVSRGSIREAFRELAELGLLVLTPHRGARVAVLTQRDVYEIYSLTAVLERLAFRLVKRRLPDALPDLTEALRRMGAAAERGDVLGVVRADLEFSDALFLHAAHRRLQHFWHSLKYQSYRLVRDYASRVNPSLPEAVAHHTKILDLLQNAHWDELRAYLEEHGDRVESLMLDFADVVGARIRCVP